VARGVGAEVGIGVGAIVAVGVGEGDGTGTTVVGVGTDVGVGVGEGVARPHEISNSINKHDPANPAQRAVALLGFECALWPVKDLGQAQRVRKKALQSLHPDGKMVCIRSPINLPPAGERTFGVGIPWQLNRRVYRTHLEQYKLCEAKFNSGKRSDCVDIIAPVVK